MHVKTLAPTSFLLGTRAEEDVTQMHFKQLGFLSVGSVIAAGGEKMEGRRVADALLGQGF